jgi:hypothetical protein
MTDRIMISAVVISMVATWTFKESVVGNADGLGDVGVTVTRT